MPIKFAFLPTDILLYLLFIGIMIFIIWARKYEHLRLPFRRIMQKPIAVVSMIILIFYVAVGLLDSIHYRQALPQEGTQGISYSIKSKSLLDYLIAPIGENFEKTYSAPFAKHLFSKETILLNTGKIVQVYPKLEYIKPKSIINLIAIGFLKGFIITIIVLAFLLIYLTISHEYTFKNLVKRIMHNQLIIPWRLIFITLFILFCIIFIILSLASHYYILGTDKVGQDVFYQAIKSIRTGLIIGILTTLIMLPFALLFGTMAGYFGGLTDDIIQYVYTTLSSIPGVLLIAASVLSLQLFIDTHSEMFPTIASRADARLLALCIILGITSWTSLCRLLRAETLKVRELDYIHAAITLGVNHFKIIVKHIIPNVMYIVFITIVIDFSGLVLAEAVLSYVGIGVDPTTMSWGNMINSARLELAREPVVWWPLLASFIFMFGLVLSANLFADALRDAFDPRIKH